MKIAGLTDIGSCRQENQDSFCARQLLDGSGWGVVCDGMGGANGGRVASTIATAEWVFSPRTKREIPTTFGLEAESCLTRAEKCITRPRYLRASAPPITKPRPLLESPLSESFR